MTQKVANCAGSDSDAVTELREQLHESHAIVADLSKELQENREMLIEAAEAYAAKEEQAESAVQKLQQYTEKIQQQEILLLQMSQDLTAAQQLSSEHVATLEDRESQLEELQQAVAVQKEDQERMMQTEKDAHEKCKAELHKYRGLYDSTAEELMRVARELTDLKEDDCISTAPTRTEQQELEVQLHRTRSELQQYLDINAKLKQEAEDFVAEKKTHTKETEELVLKHSDAICKLKEDIKILKEDNKLKEEESCNLSVLLKSSQLELEHNERIHQKQVDEIKEAKNVLHAEVLDLREKIKELERISVEISTSNEDPKASELKEEMSSQSNTIKELTAKCNDLANSVSKLDEEKQIYKNKFEELKKGSTGTIRYKDCELANLKKEHEDTRQQLQQLKETQQLTVKNEGSIVAKLQDSNSKLSNEVSLKTQSLVEAESKIIKLKEESKKSKEQCQMLQKESCAMRAARDIEVSELNHLKSQISALQESNTQKDEEIKTLQLEVKKVISTNVVVSAQSSAPLIMNVKEEAMNSEESFLRKQLVEKDEQISKLMEKLSVAPREGASSDEHRDSYELPPPPLSLPKVKLHRLEREEEDITKNSHVRRPTRRTAAKSCQATNTTDECSENSESDYDPQESSSKAERSNKKSTTRKSARPKKTPARIDNPHLQNQENNANLLNVPKMGDTNANTVEANAKIPNSKSTTGRRRKLHTADAEMVLECSPNLVEPDHPTASPHTVVRRKLRSKQQTSK